MKTINQFVVKLEKFEKNSIKELIRAQQETAKAICNDVKELAPKKTGRYAESIKTSQTTVEDNKIKTSVYSDAIVVSSDGTRYSLGYLLETGTSPHIIVPVFAKALHFVIDGEDIFTKKVQHPGTVAQPHFIPALNKNKRLYKQNIKRALRRSFNG